MPATAVKQGQKKDGPYCTHCKYHGHIVEKCYKFHGYPPGFKQKQKSTSEGNTFAFADQVTTLEDKSTKDMIALPISKS